MDGQRIASRRRVLKAGSIEVGGDAFECTVRNLSDRGAALEVMTPLYIPDRFTLVLQSEQSKRECRIIWRKQKRIGVTFD
jgi:hypothetical protein